MVPNLLMYYLLPGSVYFGAKSTGLFGKIDEMLNIMYQLYKTSAKRLRVLKRFADAWEVKVPIPTKATGTRWIDHKIRAMQIVLENYGILVAQVESLSQTDSQQQKRAELQGYVTIWKHATYPLHMAIYLDILSPLHRLRLGFQQDLHEPVKAVRRVQEFTWTMAKLKLLIDEGLDEPDGMMTNYKKFVAQVKETDEGFRYQNIQLTDYTRMKGLVNDHYNSLLEISPLAWKSVSRKSTHHLSL